MYIRTLLAAGWLLSAQFAAAQAPPPPSPAPPQGVQELTTDVVDFEGTVARFLVNANGDMEGVLLRDGTQVAFPSHLSAALTEAVKTGDRVSITGYRHTTVPVVRAYMIRDEVTQRSVVDRPPEGPPVPQTPAPLTAMQASGKVERLIYGREGEATGVMISDGTLIHLPPHAVPQFVDLMRPGVTVVAQGYGVLTPYGRSIEAAYLGSESSRLRAVFAPRPGEGPRRPQGPRGAAPPPPIPNT